MKIKTMAMDYDAVMALPRPEHKPPQKPNPLLRALIRALSAGDLRDTGFTYETRDLEKLGSGPCLVLMKNGQFVDQSIGFKPEAMITAWINGNL